MSQESIKISPGSNMITNERFRQIEVEGWDDKNDDGYTDNELLMAAASYIGLSMEGGDVPEREDIYEIWPWANEMFKPTTPIRNLVKAGALIAAEIDRRIRAGQDGNN